MGMEDRENDIREDNAERAMRQGREAEDRAAEVRIGANRERALYESRQAEKAATGEPKDWGHGQHLTVDIYHHFPEGLPIDLSAITGSLNVLVTLPAQPPPPPRPQATHAVLTLTPIGASMPGQITVDTTNETATLAFVDDKGNVAAGPAGVVVTYTSDNPAVATINANGAVAPVGIGTANLSATLTNADGSPVLEADNVTPFPTPQPVQVTVSAGPAVGDALVLSV